MCMCHRQLILVKQRTFCLVTCITSTSVPGTQWSWLLGISTIVTSKRRYPLWKVCHLCHTQWLYTGLVLFHCAQCVQVRAFAATRGLRSQSSPSSTQLHAGLSCGDSPPVTKTFGNWSKDSRRLWGDVLIALTRVFLLSVFLTCANWQTLLVTIFISVKIASYFAKQ